MTNRLVPADQLRSYVARIFEGHKMPAEDAAVVADNLVEADLRGVESHGVNLVSLYCTRLDTGLMMPETKITIEKEDATTALLHGGLGLGQVAGMYAINMGVRKAKEHGVAAVGVRESTHLGALAYYTARAAEQGCIALAVQNGPSIVPPYGGLTGVFSTNPFSFAAPANRERTVVLDMATTAVAGNKIILYRKKNQPIPDWWATDDRGKPTTDPHVASLDHLQWFGGYKGFGIAMMVEIMSGCLMNASFGHTELTEGIGHGKARVAKGYLFIVLDITRFVPLELFKSYMDTLIEDIRSGERAEGVDRIYVPGEIEHLRMDERLRDGIPLDDALIAELEKLGGELGLGALIAR
jgi:LDH2 family malate/lactate/ureidoglycolate dehydrogenase